MFFEPTVPSSVADITVSRDQHAAANGSTAPETTKTASTTQPASGAPRRRPTPPRAATGTPASTPQGGARQVSRTYEDPDRGRRLAAVRRRRLLEAGARAQARRRPPKLDQRDRHQAGRARPDAGHADRPTRAREGQLQDQLRDVARLGKAVPADDDTRSLVVQLDAAAKRSGVDFDTASTLGSGLAGAQSERGHGPTRPRRASSLRPRARSSRRRRALGDAVQLLASAAGSSTCRPSSRGSSASSRSNNQRIDATGRLLRVESISITPSAAGLARTCTAQIGAARLHRAAVEGVAGTAGAPSAATRTRARRRRPRRRRARRRPRPRPPEQRNERPDRPPGASSCAAGCGRSPSCWSPRSSAVPVLLAKSPSP